MLLRVKYPQSKFRMITQVQRKSMLSLLIRQGNQNGANYFSAYLLDFKYHFFHLSAGPYQNLRLVKILTVQMYKKYSKPAQLLSEKQYVERCLI